MRIAMNDVARQGINEISGTIAENGMIVATMITG
jgi:hypothetical protein